MPIRTTLDQRTQWGLAILAAALWAAVVLYGALGSWPADLSAMYLAGYFHNAGHMDLIYASPVRFFGSDMPPTWIAFRDAWTSPDNAVFPFVYPPIWAALMAPVASSLTPYEFFDLAYFVQVTMIAASIFLAYRIVRPAMPVLVWTLLSIAILWVSLITATAILHNQPQITVAFLCLLAFERYGRGHSSLAGILLALATAIKLTPLFLVLVFVIDRNWRALATFLLTGGLLALASLALTGPALHWVFLSKLAVISEQIAIMRINWAMEAALFEIWSWATDIRPLLTTEDVQMPIKEPLWITLITRTTLIAGLIWIFVQARRRGPEPLLALKIALIVTLTGPLAWAHHYLFCLFFLPALFSIWPQRLAAVLVLIIVVGSSVPVFTWLNLTITGIHATMLSGVGAMLLFFLASMLAAPRRI